MVKQNHPNCPICSKNLRKMYSLNNNWYLNDINITKLYRLYIRVNKNNKRSFKPIGWYCKKCEFTIMDDYFEKLRIDHQNSIKALSRALAKKGI